MIYELAIIGGGPAGVSAAIYASRKRLRTVLVTESFDGQSVVSPEIQNWIGDIAISGQDLVTKMKNHLLAYKDNIVDIAEGSRVSKLEKGVDENGKTLFTITAGSQVYQAKTIIISTGSHRRKIEAIGSDTFDGKGVVYCATCDGPLFADQDVCVVGAGNAAFETAMQLLAYCKSVTLFNRGDQYRADPITVQKACANEKFNVVKNAEIKEIKGNKFVSSVIYTDKVTNKDIELPVTGVFVEIGLLPNTDFLKGVVELNSFGQIKIDARTAKTSTEGIWAAGDCTDLLYHQNNIAAGFGITALEDVFFNLHSK